VCAGVLAGLASAALFVSCTATEPPLKDGTGSDLQSDVSACELMRDPDNNTDFVLRSADPDFVPLKLSVDDAYLRGSVSRTGPSERSALLLYLSPQTLRPISAGLANSAEGGSLKLGFQIPLQEQIDNVAESGPMPDIAALEGSAAETESDAVAATVPEGLTVIRDSGKDVYYAPSDGRALIRCVARAIPTGNDRCYQKTNYGSLTAEVSYDRSLLPEWNTIGSHMRELLDCATE